MLQEVLSPFPRSCAKVTVCCAEINSLLKIQLLLGFHPNVSGRTRASSISSDSEVHRRSSAHQAISSRLQESWSPVYQKVVQCSPPARGVGHHTSVTEPCVGLGQALKHPCLHFENCPICRKEYQDIVGHSSCSTFYGEDLKLSHGLFICHTAQCAT